MGIYESMGIIGTVAFDFVRNLIGLADNAGGIMVYVITGLMIYLLVKWTIGLFAGGKKEKK